MKIKKIRQIFTLLLTVSLLSLCVPALAAASSVTFEKNKLIIFEPGSAYTDTDLFGSFKNVMPGDELTEKIEAENQNSDYDYIKVYLRAILHNENDNPLSEKVLAELRADDRRNAAAELEYMYDFLSGLSMEVWNGTDKIFEGSPKELDGLSSDVYLGTLRQGESLSLDVKLTVPIDLGNEFANRIGEVDWVFACEGFDDPVPPPEDDSYLTVRKLWEDDEDNPESVTVNLLKNGEVQSSVNLSQENQWTHTWDSLSKDDKWTVKELVPEGYYASYFEDGNITTITNTKTSPSVSGTELTVEKLWADSGSGRPDSVEVILLQDGEKYDSVVLDSSKGWRHTWDKLDSSRAWSVAEANVADGYTASYALSGTTVKITNRAAVESIEFVDLTVKKVWTENREDQPDRVGVTLYKGKLSVETVYLGDWNNWSYTWKDLDGSESWSVVEVIPKGYTPHYSNSKGVVTISNTASLIQTGQLNWPIPVLGSLGLLLLAYGIIIITKKRRNRNA